MPTNDGAPDIPGSNDAGGSAASAQQEQKTPPPVSEIERKLMSAAEELGTWLGTAERKATEFFHQQPTITDHLVKIRDTASRLLAQIEKGRDRSR
jgi:hypothetical protein